MPEGSGNESTERSLRTQAELGRLLAAAKGYRVLAGDGTPVGWLDHVRYERHADHPDEIVVRSRGLLRPRQRALPFDMVKEIRPRERTVVLRTTGGAAEPSPVNLSAADLRGSSPIDGAEPGHFRKPHHPQSR